MSLSKISLKKGDKRPSDDAFIYDFEPHSHKRKKIENFEVCLNFNLNKK